MSYAYGMEFSEEREGFVPAAKAAQVLPTRLANGDVETEEEVLGYVPAPPTGPSQSVPDIYYQLQVAMQNVKANTKLPRLPRLTKKQAMYAAMSPPPLFHEYKCKWCLFFNKGADGQPDTCDVVEGDIDPEAWCMVWAPTPVDPPLAWVVRGIMGTFQSVAQSQRVTPE